MTVLFHGNFALNRSRMAGLLKAALDDPKLDNAGLAKPFGYGAPFSQRYRSWLHKTGVTELRLPMKLTQIGQVVVTRDPKFQSAVTQWLLHHELVTDPERAEAWHYFAHEFLPNHSQFSKSQLIDGLTEKLRWHSEMHFGPGSKLNRQIALKIIQVYTDSSGLGDLGIIKPESGHFIRMEVEPLGPWESSDKLDLAYKY